MRVVIDIVSFPSFLSGENDIDLSQDAYEPGSYEIKPSMHAQYTHTQILQETKQTKWKTNKHEETKQQNSKPTKQTDTGKQTMWKNKQKKSVNNQTGKKTKYKQRSVCSKK